MNRILRKIIRDLVKLLASLNYTLPAVLEQDMANIQGKGIGVDSVRNEVYSALKFATHTHTHTHTHTQM